MMLAFSLSIFYSTSEIYIRQQHTTLTTLERIYHFNISYACAHMYISLSSRHFAEPLEHRREILFNFLNFLQKLCETDDFFY